MNRTVDFNGNNIIPNSKKLIEEFTEKFPVYANHEGKNKLENLARVMDFYNSTYLQRKLIHEVQAYTAFNGYTNSDVLYNEIKDAEDSSEWLLSIPNRMFDDVFRASLIINGCTSIKSAAEIAGENDYSIDKYIEFATSYTKTKIFYNNNDSVFQQGLNHQRGILEDKERISTAARKLIDIYYLNKK